jgi:hypothetical protein
MDREVPMVMPLFGLGGLRSPAVMALWCAATFAQSQTHPPTDPTAPSLHAPARSERADPLDVQARVPAAAYVSSLAGFRRLGDDQRIDWRQANEVVNRIGGWRAYAREASQPEPAPSSPPPSPPPSGAHPHGGPTR